MCIKHFNAQDSKIVLSNGLILDRKICTHYTLRININKCRNPEEIHILFKTDVRSVVNININVYIKVKVQLCEYEQDLEATLGTTVDISREKKNI